MKIVVILIIFYLSQSITNQTINVNKESFVNGTASNIICVQKDSWKRSKEAYSYQGGDINELTTEKNSFQLLPLAFSLLFSENIYDIIQYILIMCVVFLKVATILSKQV
jgi:hypothetical protein